MIPAHVRADLSADAPLWDLLDDPSMDVMEWLGKSIASGADAAAEVSTSRNSQSNSIRANMWCCAWHMLRCHAYSLDCIRHALGCAEPKAAVLALPLAACTAAVPARACLSPLC